MKTIVNLEIDDEVLQKASELGKLEGRSRKKQLEITLERAIKEH